MFKIASLAVGFVLLASTTACGGEPADQPVAPTTAVAGTAPAVASATPAVAGKSLTAAAIISRLRAAKLGLADVVVQTEDNDPNNLLGRPNGYSSRASADLPGGDRAADRYSVDRGLVVEVFDSAELAQKRSDYIKGLQADNPILGTEWHYLTGDGTGLVRVSGNVKPSLAKKIQAAL
jgi:hypothetical protein